MIPEGFASFEVGGRRYVGPLLTGTKALDLAADVMPIIADHDGDDVERFAGRIIMDPRTLRLAPRTLAGWSCDGVDCVSGFDALFRGRILEAAAAALSAWRVNGFFGSAAGSASGVQTPPESGAV